MAVETTLAILFLSFFLVLVVLYIPGFQDLVPVSFGKETLILSVIAILSINLLNSAYKSLMLLLDSMMVVPCYRTKWDDNDMNDKTSKRQEAQFSRRRLLALCAAYGVTKRGKDVSPQKGDFNSSVTSKCYVMLHLQE